LFSQIKAPAGLLWHCWATIRRDRPFPRAWCVSLSSELNLAGAVQQSLDGLWPRGKRNCIFLLAPLKHVWPLEKTREGMAERNFSAPGQARLADRGSQDWSCSVPGANAHWTIWSPRSQRDPWAVLFSYQWWLGCWAGPRMAAQSRYAVPLHTTDPASPVDAWLFFLRTGPGWVGRAKLGSIPPPAPMPFIFYFKQT
jgi:hypothetical protein